MKAYFLCDESSELKEHAKSLGYERSLFLDKDFAYVKAESRKDLIKGIKSAKKKKLFAIAYANTEEDLRYLVEQSQADMVLGTEYIHQKDSMHYPKGAVDHVIAELARKKNKVIAFNLNEMYAQKSVKKKAQALRRIKFSLKVSKKTKAKTVLTHFVKSKEDLVYVQEMKAFERVLSKS